MCDDLNQYNQTNMWMKKKNATSKRHMDHHSKVLSIQRIRNLMNQISRLLSREKKMTRYIKKMKFDNRDCISIQN